MKKIALAIFILLFSCNLSFAYDLNKISDDVKIQSALRVLESNNQAAVFSRLERSKTKIIFYDLTLISYSYAKHYAVASTDEYGENYILINSNLSRSPKEALACLIAHESVHQLPQATFNEEVLATTTEAKTWQILRDRVPASASDDILVRRLNRLADMQAASSQNNNMIAKAISNNAFYQDQLAKN